MASGWNATDSFGAPVHSYPHGMAPWYGPLAGRNYAGRSLEEHGANSVHCSPRDRRPYGHAAIRLVESLDHPCDPVVLDGFPSIFVAFRGVLWHFNAFYLGWWLLHIIITLVQSSTHQAATYYVHLHWWQSIYGMVGANVVFTATLHLQKFGVRETNQVGKGW